MSRPGPSPENDSYYPRPGQPALEVPYPEREREGETYPSEPGTKPGHRPPVILPDKDRVPSHPVRPGPPEDWQPPRPEYRSYPKQYPEYESKSRSVWNFQYLAIASVAVRSIYYYTYGLPKLKP